MEFTELGAGETKEAEPTEIGEDICLGRNEIDSYSWTEATRCFMHRVLRLKNWSIVCVLRIEVLYHVGTHAGFSTRSRWFDPARFSSNLLHKFQR